MGGELPGHRAAARRLRLRVAIIDRKADGAARGNVRALATNGGGLGQSGLAYRLARLYADYNHIHPFREGNGRAGTLLLHAVAALCGRRLDLCAVSREERYAASRDSMPFRRDGRPNHRPFLPLFAGALC
jgi:cell filamentation protein